MRRAAVLRLYISKNVTESTRTIKATTKYLAGDLEKLKESIRNSEKGLTEEHEQALEYAFEASEFYLFAAIEKMDELFGGFDGYLKNGLHVTDEEVEKLRDRYLEK